MYSCWGTALRILIVYRNQLIVLLTSLAALPLPLLINTQEAVCGYCVIIMAVFWCTEALPLPVTALLPVFLFPLLGLLPIEEVCANYMKEIIMMYFGSLAVALAMEKCNLHKRIAYKILMVTGTQPRWMMLGFILPTWFMSMWISNTACAAMMLPMLEVVLAQLEPSGPGGHAEVTSDESDDTNSNHSSETRIEMQSEKEAELEKNGVAIIHIQEPVITRSNLKNSQWASTVSIPGLYDSQTNLVSIKKVDLDDESRSTTSTEPPVAETDTLSDSTKEKRSFDKLAVGFTMCVTFAANIGGIATLTGSGPNMVMKGQVDQLWEAKGRTSPLDYPSWMMYGLPVSLLSVLLLWICMQLMYLGWRETLGFRTGKATNEKRDEAVRELVRKEYKKLGSLSFGEVMVGIIFTLLVCLWFFLDPTFLKGWATSFKTGYIGDAVPAVLLALSMLVIPQRLPKLARFQEDYTNEPEECLLDWKLIHHKMPWGTLLLFGGGFALADATIKSGLAEWLGGTLEVFSGLPGWLMVLVLSTLASLLTQVTSNAATCTLLMPVMATMAESIGKNPLYLMFPICIATSFAFMLPVANPPNAIAYAFGRFKIGDMVKAGAGINVLCLLVVLLATHTWGMSYFALDEVPWQSARNMTASVLLSTQ